MCIRDRDYTCHETLGFRNKETSNEKNILVCWNELRHTHPCIGTKWQNEFRVDMYGNVVANPVAKTAYDLAITKMDVDHVFPWSRGGRSTRSSNLPWDAGATGDSPQMMPSEPP
eukprot:3027752-Pyramimonas_sp.AAC.1